VNRWVYIVDESISLGKERILLVLGVRLRDLNFTDCLDLAYTQVLSLEVASIWESTNIALILKGLTQ